MGYSLYITRREDWSDSDGPSIELREWIALVDADPTLRWSEELGDHFAIYSDCDGAKPSWLNWERGNLESKHPHRGMIRKMHLVATALSARLIGEEGESYDSFGEEVPRTISMPLPRRDSLWQRVRSALFPPKAADPHLLKGCRVRDAFGRLGTVTAIDLYATFGIGEITVRYDDGSIAHFAAEAHGLKKLDTSASGT